MSKIAAGRRLALIYGAVDFRAAIFCFPKVPAVHNPDGLVDAAKESLPELRRGHEI